MRPKQQAVIVVGNKFNEKFSAASHTEMWLDN